jgi:hypothetical protein
MEFQRAIEMQKENLCEERGGRILVLRRICLGDGGSLDSRVCCLCPSSISKGEDFGQILYRHMLIKFSESGRLKI